jgi:hypothetical protein
MLICGALSVVLAVCSPSCTCVLSLSFFLSLSLTHTHHAHPPLLYTHLYTHLCAACLVLRRRAIKIFFYAANVLNLTPDSPFNNHRSMRFLAFYSVSMIVFIVILVIFGVKSYDAFDHDAKIDEWASFWGFVIAFISVCILYATCLHLSASFTIMCVCMCVCVLLYISNCVYCVVHLYLCILVSSLQACGVFGAYRAWRLYRRMAADTADVDEPSSRQADDADDEYI